MIYLYQNQIYPHKINHDTQKTWDYYDYNLLGLKGDFLFSKIKEYAILTYKNHSSEEFKIFSSYVKERFPEHYSIIEKIELLK